MRFRGKKPIFNYDDTWSLDMTLAPIIFEGLKKYKEIITSEDNCAGFPGRLYGSCDFGYTVEDGDEELAQQTWYRILDCMIYAFDESNEPDSSNYDYDIKWVPKEVKDGEYRKVSLEVINEDEHNRYKKDMEKWEEDCEFGRKMFAKYFKNLWW